MEIKMNKLKYVFYVKEESIIEYNIYDDEYESKEEAEEAVMDGSIEGKCIATESVNMVIEEFDDNGDVIIIENREIK